MVAVQGYDCISSIYISFQVLWHIAFRCMTASTRAFFCGLFSATIKLNSTLNVICKYESNAKIVKYIGKQINLQRNFRFEAAIFHFLYYRIYANQCIRKILTLLFKDGKCCCNRTVLNYQCTFLIEIDFDLICYVTERCSRKAN